MLRRRYINTYFSNDLILKHNKARLKNIDLLLLKHFCTLPDELAIYKLTNKTTKRLLINLTQFITNKNISRYNKDVSIHCLDNEIATVQIGRYMFMNFESLFDKQRKSNINMVAGLLNKLSDYLITNTDGADCEVFGNITLQIQNKKI